MRVLFQAGKPVFVAAAIPCRSTEAWKRRKSSYKDLVEGDADFQDDLNMTPEELFGQVFGVLNSLAEIRYSRLIFVIHGRDNYFKDTLVNLLQELDFIPVLLQDEPKGMIYENIDDLKKESLKIAKILKEAGYKGDLSKLL